MARASDDADDSTPAHPDAEVSAELEHIDFPPEPPSPSRKSNLERCIALRMVYVAKNPQPTHLSQAASHAPLLCRTSCSMSELLISRVSVRVSRDVSFHRGQARDPRQRQATCSRFCETDLGCVLDDSRFFSSSSILVNRRNLCFRHTCGADDRTRGLFWLAPVPKVRGEMLLSMQPLVHFQLASAMHGAYSDMCTGAKKFHLSAQ